MRVIYTCSRLDSGASRPTVALLGECAFKTVDRLAGDWMRSTLTQTRPEHKRGVRARFVMYIKLTRTLADPPFRPDRMEL